MHELPLVQSLIRKSAAHAEEKHAIGVKSISLVVGDNSGYVADSIQMYFDIAAEGTVCEGAELIVRRIKPKLKCDRCGELFERRPFSFSCPTCGGDGSPTDIGRELYIDEIELIIDTGDDTNEGNDPRTGDGGHSRRE